MALLELGIVAGYMAKQLINSNEYNEKADLLNRKSFEIMALTQKKIQDQCELTENALSKLINRKKGIYLTSIKRFIELYEKVIKLNVTINEDNINTEEALLTDFDIDSLREMAEIAGRELTSKESFVKYLVTGYGGMKLHQSKINLSIAEMRKEQSLVIEKHGENICLTLYEIEQKANKFSEILAFLNVLLIKAIAITKEVIERNGGLRCNYTKEDKEKLRLCMNIADTLKNFLLEPLIDSNGELANDVSTAIRKGEEYIKQINTKMNR
ncbi:hypothetical protein [Clostridium saudiense]|uniref:hypothetical protein n=1 Tax=Clostridium saudiense TaxID=1414720 RepID=UPI0004B3C97A|nr:hypothetical protein [Clostridium saudiense]